MLLFVLLFGLSPLQGQENERKKVRDRITALEINNKNYAKDTVYIDLLNEYGTELRYYDNDSLFVVAKQALHYSEGIGYRRGQCEAILRIADYYSDSGDYEKAIRYYSKSMEVAKEIKHTELLLRSTSNLAGEYIYKGDYAKGLSEYLNGIELAEKSDNKEMLSIINENIANLYASQKDYNQSLEFFKKVKKINNTIGDEVIAAETMSNLASVYADMGQLEYAMFNINQSIAIFEKHRIMDWLAYTYEIKGKIYLKQKKYKWALRWYNQSEMLHTDLDDDRGIIDLYNGIAEAHLGIKNDSISQKYALEAFDISNKISFLEGTQKCAHTLYNIHKNKGDFAKALDYHELYQQLTDSLSRNENKKSLTLLQTKTQYDDQKAELIRENEKALAEQQNYVIAAIIVLMIFIVITLLVHRNQKIQKKLNIELNAQKRTLQAREAELQDSNETKTKLFSIIGHDLRGPMGALQGLLQMFSAGEINKNEFLNFIPKLKADVDHISFTLNNLLSWGYTQMNGANTKPTVVALETLVTENIALLSEIAEKKSIKIVSELAENTLIWSDSNQIDIVIRNLISNALKFTPENGMVIIKAADRNKQWEISVRDTGVGMDKITMEKIFSKNESHTTYGTNNEKGTGLGLSLCKEMVEKNNGTIWVESAVRKGSCFYFTLPKSEKKYSKAS